MPSRPEELRGQKRKKQSTRRQHVLRGGATHALPKPMQATRRQKADNGDREGFAEGQVKRACNGKEQSKRMRPGNFSPVPAQCCTVRGPGDAGCPALSCMEGKAQQCK